jgi:hypothetical protein
MDSWNGDEDSTGNDEQRKKAARKTNSHKGILLMNVNTAEV